MTPYHTKIKMMTLESHSNEKINRLGITQDRAKKYITNERRKMLSSLLSDVLKDGN